MHKTTIEHLLAHYPALLLDAYGVLVNDQGALPGAVTLIERLNTEQRPYAIVTNSASHLPEQLAERFRCWGLAIPAERIITSGRLLEQYYAEHRLQNASTLWLGPAEAKNYVERAGGKLATETDEVEVVIIADDAGFDWTTGMNRVLNITLQHLDNGRPLHLLLLNPDLIYPATTECYGLTAGALAAMIEAVLAERYPESSYSFTRLGKPYRPIFDYARSLLPTEPLLMIGDQLATDIRGARQAGIDCALIAGGVSTPESAIQQQAYAPEWLLATLRGRMG